MENKVHGPSTKF